MLEVPDVAIEVVVGVLIEPIGVGLVRVAEMGVVGVVANEVNDVVEVC